jgi:hypothetical protein
LRPGLLTAAPPGLKPLGNTGLASNKHSRIRDSRTKRAGPLRFAVRELEPSQRRQCHRFLSLTAAYWGISAMSTDLIDEEYRYAIFPDRPFGPIPDEQEVQQWSRIYFLFGQATFRSQAYEDGMARFIIAAEGRWNRSGKPAEEILRLPLGLLQKEYPKYVYLEDHHRDRMADALKIRNSLAHSFYRHRMNLLESVEGRAQVIRELHAAIELFRQERDEMYWNLSLLTGELPL